MIYFGVHLFNQAFHIAAISDSFAPLGHTFIKIHNHNSLVPWMRSLMAGSNEPNKWFFDEFQFKHPKSLATFFINFGCCQQVFLVNHRKLVDMARFIDDWNIFYLNYQVIANCKKSQIAMLLASSVRLFEEKHITLFYDDNDMPF